MRELLREERRWLARSCKDRSFKDQLPCFRRFFQIYFSHITHPVVAGYWPFSEEADPIPLLTSLAQDGVLCALPSIHDVKAPLLFKAWSPGDPLRSSSLLGAQEEILEPLPEKRFLMPHIVLVPLLGFDREGHRLGYGKGFYDKTLHFLREKNPEMIAIGFGFEGQERESIPVTSQDESLDWIFTQNEIVCCLKTKDSLLKKERVLHRDLVKKF